MIAQVMRIGFQRLWHGRLEMLLVFIVPVVFFSIFALIFDRREEVGSGEVATALVDLDQTPLSRAVFARLASDPLLRVSTAAPPTEPAEWEDLTASCQEVLSGRAKLAIVAPAGWADSLMRSDPLTLTIAADTSDPVAPRVVEALVHQAVGRTIAELQIPASPAAGSSPEAVASPFGAPVRVLDLLAEGKSNPVVSQFAAGIAVMFLLFTASGNAGSLLEEEETQTLERLMCSRLSMSKLLLGKWLFLASIGFLQVLVMFGWAQLMFGVDVLGRLPGFLLMTAVTAGAAASLALAMAAACRSRAQLNAVSTILILTMSAVGGSMVPRYVMSESMQQFGRATFNAWAIDGYNKLFWRNLPATQLGPELAVMAVSAVALLVIARVLAMRWETA
ncbi:ABC-2 family transporter protein [Pirellulimonas nuda]|uniref:ABC-2 family transporter protein n=1 Tax=Pirellulimonas nuda TaxID=2528009 RepID=A0A518DJH5_9BACT|nr:ABC transporter permease [Pirellulimonas nuda]QDU91630.1 ABC-2 family transporter protein [Pirellulimonas nuda]